MPRALIMKKKSRVMNYNCVNVSVWTSVTVIDSSNNLTWIH
jgi:hypothetical protein